MLEWTKNLQVNVEDIDSQHKLLFDKVNEFLKAMAPDKRKDEFERTLKFLKEYVIFHFNTEEGLMKNSAYPHESSHKLLHEEFKRAISDLEDKARSKGITLAITVETNHFLTNWLIKHISVEDKKLGEHINGSR